MAISASSKILASDISGISATANAAYSSSFIPKGTNPVANSTQDTTSMWQNLGPGVYWFTELRLIDQPQQYGFLINYVCGSDVFQIWSSQNAGPVRFRQGNASGWGNTWNHNAAWADNCNWANGCETANYAHSAGRAYPKKTDGGDLNMNWHDHGGHPAYLWGGDDGANMYVFPPGRLSVNYANSAGWANSANASVMSSVAGYGWKINTLQGSYNITNATGTGGKLPSGGMWLCYVVGGSSGAGNVFTKAGGSSVSGVVVDHGDYYDYGSLLAIRIS